MCTELGNLVWDRFIPTGVGNALVITMRLQPPIAVHPHGRGERQSQALLRHPERRFIPTGVGNASSV